MSLLERLKLKPTNLNTNYRFPVNIPIIKELTFTEDDYLEFATLLDNKGTDKVRKELRERKRDVLEEEKVREEVREEAQEEVREAAREEVDIEKELKEPTETVIKKARLKRAVKGISVLKPKDWVPIDGVSIQALAEKREPVRVKASKYYLNNREKFINFINSKFNHYKQELNDNKDNISCDSQSSEFSLLIHQQLVRDYLNLYSPYRGLLLYHGLGSGKTCTSIAIAEGLKNAKKVFILTPASLEENYLSELKKCGDDIYKKNQHWNWIPLPSSQPELDTLSAALQLKIEYIKKAGGVFLVDNTKPSNYSFLSIEQKNNLDEQINQMIKSKYEFIHYNGLRRAKLAQLTHNFEVNIFDNSVVIIDEAHNFISRIVNKLEKEKSIAYDKKGKRTMTAIAMSLILYEMLLTAQNSRVILLTGTPMINYPNELGILFNILRGYIYTWEISLEVNPGQVINKEILQNLLIKNKNMDYLDYSNKKLFITRNPFGFENNYSGTSDYIGVSSETENKRRNIVPVEEMSNEAFEKNIIRTLISANITISPGPTSVIIHPYKCLPDRLEDFVSLFILEDKTIKNPELFKRRIMGLTSYFRSAQEQLLPKYDAAEDLNIIMIPMSDLQFTLYESKRVVERKQEKGQKVAPKPGQLYTEPSSTYRIWSRLYCNFVMPTEYPRPMPDGSEDKPIAIEVVLDEEKEEEIIIKKKERKKRVKAAEPREDKSGEEGKGKEGEGESGEDESGEDESGEDESGEDESGEEGEEEKKEEEKKGKVIKKRAVKKAALTDEEDDLNNFEDPEYIAEDEELEKEGNSTYIARLQSALQFLKENASTYLTESALQIYSPKFLEMLININDEEHIGLHLVYSQFRTFEGIGIFQLILNYNGYTQFKIKKDSQGQWILNISPENRGKPTYALYTGTESREEKEAVRNIYNGDWESTQDLSPILIEELKQIAPNNNLGEIIKIFMITASGSEGINLRNTRYVHIMDPYWHPVRTEQVIGRARRICSHKNLPRELQTVEVFLYLMKFSDEQIASDKSIELKRKDLSKLEYPIPGSKDKAKIPFTSDQTLFEISAIKEKISNQLLKNIKEASIDCATYSDGNTKEGLKCLQFGETDSTTFSYNPNIALDNKGTIGQTNKRAIEWKGQKITLNKTLPDGTVSKVVYVYRELEPNSGNLYDLDSYQQAVKTPGLEPTLIGTINLKTKKVEYI
jgi:hypothetical protein